MLFFISFTSFSQSKDPFYWDHVHHQSRLIVNSYDTTVVGKVLNISRKLDGDYHLIIQSDSTHTIVAEIICACRGIMSACRGYTNNITIPKVGDYVRIIGDSVTDKNHNDLPEIHPVKMLTILH